MYFRIAVAYVVFTVWFLYLFQDTLRQEYFDARCFVYRHTGLCPVFSISVDTLFIVQLIFFSPLAVMIYYICRFPRAPTHFAVWIRGDRIFRYVGRESLLKSVMEGSDYYICPLDPLYTLGMREWMESRDFCEELVRVLVEEFHQSCLQRS